MNSKERGNHPKETHLKRAPGKIQERSDPQKGIIRNHYKRPTKKKLLHVLDGANRQIDREQNRRRNQQNTIPHSTATGGENDGTESPVVATGLR